MHTSLSTVLLLVAADSASSNDGITPLKFISTPDARRRRLYGHVPPPDGTQLHGNLHTLGYFAAEACIGPPTNQRFDLLVNTAGHTTAVTCAGCTGCGTHTNPPYDASLSSTSQRLACDDPDCRSNRCVTDPDGTRTCWVTTSFTEGSAFSGHMVSDEFILSPHSTHIRASIGCLTSESGLFRTQRADGMLGLARQSSATSMTILDRIVELQLASPGSTNLPENVFSICLASTRGSLILGGQLPEDRREEVSRWTPMLWGGGGHDVHLREILVGEITVTGEGNMYGQPPSSPAALRSSIDTGTTFMYVPPLMYNALKSRFRTNCGPWPMGTCHAHAIQGDYPDDVCYQANRTEMEAFEPWTLVFDGNTELVVPSVAYAYELRRDIWCLSLFVSQPTSSAGTSSNAVHVTIGSAMLRHHEVVFDRERDNIGFFRADCNGIHDRTESSVLVGGYGLSGCHDQPRPPPAPHPWVSPPYDASPPFPSDYVSPPQWSTYTSPPTYPGYDTGWNWGPPNAYLEPRPPPPPYISPSLLPPHPPPHPKIPPWPPWPPYSPILTPEGEGRGRVDPRSFTYVINGVLSNELSFSEAAEAIEGLAPGSVAAIAIVSTLLMLCGCCCCIMVLCACRNRVLRIRELEENFRLMSAQKQLDPFDERPVVDEEL